MNLSSFLLERKRVMIVCLTKLDLYTYKYSGARKKKKREVDKIRLLLQY